MKPLIILLAAFATCLLATQLLDGEFNVLLSGRVAMAVMLVFTSLGHFAFRKGMAAMIPEPIPFKSELVLLTAVFEIAGGIGLLIPALVKASSIFLIFFFILVLPANISAAKRSLDYQTGQFNGNGPRYLWFRIPLQALFIAWTWYFSFGSL